MPTERTLSTAAAMLAAVLSSTALVAQTRARLEPAECPFAGEAWASQGNPECRWLVVPESRDRSDAPSVRLFVVVLRGERATLPPLVMLHGGPGQSALVPMVSASAREAARDRDHVFYDQRGAGLSQPDPCPEYAGRVLELSGGGGVLARDENPQGRAALVSVASECAASMRARGIDPAAYSTASNAADLKDLRLALGYERWDVYGASYGARLALAALRHDPQGIRSVVLENPSPQGTEAGSALATQYALTRIFAACVKSAACQAAYPDVEQSFIAVFDTLSRTPLTLPAAGGNTRALTLDGEGFVLGVRRLLRTRAGIAMIPLLLNELHRGNRVRAARELVGMDALAGSANRAVFWLVQCADEYGPAYLAELVTVRSLAWRPLRSLRDNLQECPIWQTRVAPPEERAAIVSDIPTLILTGEFDARTPVEFGRRIAGTLTRAFVFEFPGETHGGRPMACRASVLQQFLTNPERTPDASCIQRMPSFEFRTTWPPQ